MRANDPAGNTARIHILARAALGVSLGLVLSYAESLVPIHLGIPGAKLGLPNLVTLCLLYLASPGLAFGTGIVRILLSGFMFGNLFSIAYSAAGFLLSFCCMLLLKKTGRFGVTGVSVAGGIAHNMGQLAAAVFLTNRYVLTYLPVLLAAGCLAGTFIGLLGAVMVKRLKGLFR